MSDFSKLVGKTNNKLGNPTSIFGKKGKDEPKKSIWINKDLYTKLKLLTINHDHTSIKYWANKAIEHAFKDGTLK